MGTGLRTAFWIVVGVLVVIAVCWFAVFAYRVMSGPWHEGSGGNTTDPGAPIGSCYSGGLCDYRGR